MLATLAVAGCNGGKDDPITVRYSPSNVFLAKDSVHCFDISNTDKNYLTKYKRENYDIIWEKEIIKPSPILIDLGYGEQKKCEFNLYGIGIDTDNLIFIVLWGGDNHNRSGIGVYTNNGEFVSNIIFNAPSTCLYSRYKGATRWNNSVIFSCENYNSDGSSTPSYILVDKNGKVIEDKEGIELVSEKDPQYCWNRGYIFNNENTLYICNLDSGTKKINILDIVKDKYPDEINMPKAKIKNISEDNDIATILTELTFYDGSKKNIYIKINYKTFVIIQ